MLTQADKQKCASLGAVNYSLLGALYHACQGKPPILVSQRYPSCPDLTMTGDSGLKEYNSRTSGRKGKNGTSADDTPNTIRDHSRVYFPSSETVQQSKGGRDVGLFQTLYFPRIGPSVAANTPHLGRRHHLFPGTVVEGRVVSARRPPRLQVHPARRAHAQQGPLRPRPGDDAVELHHPVCLCRQREPLRERMVSAAEARYRVGERPVLWGGWG